MKKEVFEEKMVKVFLAITHRHEAVLCEQYEGQFKG